MKFFQFDTDERNKNEYFTIFVNGMKEKEKKKKLTDYNSMYFEKTGSDGSRRNECDNKN